MIKKRILSIDVNTGSEAEYCQLIHQHIEDQVSGYACFSNVHMLIEAHNDISFQKVVNEATFAFPDGFPIAKSFKILYNISQARIAGMDFLPSFLKECNKKKYRVGFVGSTPEILTLVKNQIELDHPDIEITVLISPPFGQKWDSEGYINQINNNNTDVIFVALGCPKQERWMSENYAKTRAFMFGIGGALPTYAGVVERAPVWMQKIGMEWFFRLYKEPKRMFKRYLYTNTKFIYLLIKEMIYSKRHKEGI